ncbi:MAG: ATP-binding protein [Bdellovibrionota bacterium]
MTSNSSETMQELYSKIKALEVKLEAQAKESQEKLSSMLGEMDFQRALLEDKNTILEKMNGFVNRVTDSMDEILFVLDGLGRIMIVNKRVTSILGYSLDELIGKTPDFLFSTKDIEKFSNFLQPEATDSSSIIFSYFEHENHLECEASLVSKEHGEIIHLLHGSIIYNHQCREEGLVIIGTDIREIKHVQKSLEMARNDIQNLLDNLDQGFMACDSTGVVLEGCSKAASLFFGGNPVGKFFWEVVQAPAEKVSEIQKWLDCIFSESVPFEDLKSLGPGFFDKLDGRYIGFDYRPIRDQSGHIKRLIIIATDKTTERILEQKALHDARTAKMILSIVQNRSDFISNFIPEIRKIIKEIQNELGSEATKFNIDSIFRKIHTIKGTAAFYYIESIETIAASIEWLLSSIRASVKESLIAHAHQLKAEVAKLEQEFESFLNKHCGIVGDLTSGGERSVRVSEIMNIGEVLRKMLGPESELLRKYTESFLLEPIHHLFTKYGFTVQKIAGMQAKEVRLTIDESPIRIYRNHYVSLTNAMVHVFRNAVDHGLETPIERKASGKPLEGTIRVFFTTNMAASGQQMLDIHVSDDGRGIDPAVISAKAIEKKVVTGTQISRMATDEIIQLVFKPGFSTREEVTSVSGHGVGLDAVKTEAERLGGKAWIKSEMGKGSVVSLRVPIIRILA